MESFCFVSKILQPRLKLFVIKDEQIHSKLCDYSFDTFKLYLRTLPRSLLRRLLPSAIEMSSLSTRFSTQARPLLNLRRDFNVRKQEINY